MVINKIIFNSLSSESDMCRLGGLHNTDKSHLNTLGHRHSYTMLYDFIFGKFKYDECRIAEIGIAHNNGIKTFRDYFPNAHIFGFDIQSEHLDSARKDNLRNTQYFGIDCNSRVSIFDSLKSAGGNFDIIIDDASHIPEQQINVLLNSIPFLKPGGVLIIEDIYRNIDEEFFEPFINNVSKYFHSITFVETEHDKQWSGDWNNDKLLVLYRNNEPYNI